MFVSSTYRTTGLHYTHGCAKGKGKNAVTVVVEQFNNSRVSPKESLGYTELTGLKVRVWLALSSKKNVTVPFAINQPLFSPKLHTTLGPERR